MSRTNGRRSSLVIGTRGSQLALWQAEWVRARLQAVAPSVSIRLQTIQTSGDKILDAPLASIGGKGLFVKEIEEALFRGTIDLAVHSMKDVPSVLPEGLAIVCVVAREDARDVLVTRDHLVFHDLPAGATVGTSSLRRQAQLLARRPDLSIVMLRGNVNTRVRKLREGAYTAIVLAAAGLIRLGETHCVTEYLPLEVSLPAIGQGALGMESRADDAFVRELLVPLHDRPTAIAVSAERAFLKRLEGGCQVPIAGHAVVENQTVNLEGLVASLDGRCVIRDQIEGPVEEAHALGTSLANRVLNAGGKQILDVVYGRG
ncbi:MAG: hydroxymethylbilane synthase [Nitrospira sp.]|nr:hydroxymethylbilane synthase [Nitrospira sp.]MDD9859056.1 hydroxymethylbilane synthase [Nitrospira sp.]